MTKSQLRVETNKSVPFTPATREAQDEEEDDREVEATITTTYDPSKKASQMPVLWKLAGATPRARGRISGPWRFGECEAGGGGRMGGGLRRPLV